MDFQGQNIFLVEIGWGDVLTPQCWCRLQEFSFTPQCWCRLAEAQVAWISVMVAVLLRVSSSSSMVAMEVLGSCCEAERIISDFRCCLLGFLGSGSWGRDSQNLKHNGESMISWLVDGYMVVNDVIIISNYDLLFSIMSRTSGNQ